MPNLNYVRSVSPAFNVLASLNEARALGGAPIGPLGNAGGLGGSGAAPSAGPSPTDYRPPTQVYERSVFGNSFRDATQEDRSNYNQGWLSDQRNQGYGAGQVDPGLARAATQNEGGGESGGK